MEGSPTHESRSRGWSSHPIDWEVECTRPEGAFVLASASRFQAFILIFVFCGSSFIFVIYFLISFGVLSLVFSLLWGTVLPCPFLSLLLSFCLFQFIYYIFLSL